MPDYETLFREAGVIDEAYPRPESSPPSPREPTPEETRRLLSGQPLDFGPGQHWAYSNSGYVVLSQVVEAVSGRSFPDFVRENIFEPAGMLESVVPADAWRAVPDRARSYHSEGDVFENADYTPLNRIYGDDGIYTTGDDMVRWDHALHSATLVREFTLAEAFAPGKLNDGTDTPTGFGWFVGPDFVDHAGRWAGFNTYIRRYRDRRFTIIVLANCRQAGAGDLGQRIAEIYAAAPRGLDS